MRKTRGIAAVSVLVSRLGVIIVVRRDVQRRILVGIGSDIDVRCVERSDVNSRCVIRSRAVEIRTSGSSVDNTASTIPSTAMGRRGARQSKESSRENQGNQKFFDHFGDLQKKSVRLSTRRSTRNPVVILN